MRPERVLRPEKLIKIVRPEVVADVREDRDPDRRLDPIALAERQSRVGGAREEEREDDAGGRHGDSHRQVAPLVASLFIFIFLNFRCVFEREGGRGREGEKERKEEEEEEEVREEEITRR